MRIDLTKGITETSQYKAWKFPGGEIHVQLKDASDWDIELSFDIVTRLNSSDDIMFLLIFTDMLKKDYPKIDINLFLPYMPYQQADMDFGKNECFSLKTMCNLINSMNYTRVSIYDAHSNVSPALLNNSKVIDNSQFIIQALNRIFQEHFNTEQSFNENVLILSPDASAYKKIFKLCEKIRFKGQIESCSKSRNHQTGELTIKIPEFDENKIVLIVDDIALGSNTFLNIRKKIKNKSVYLAVSHGVFNDNVDKLESEFVRVFTTNSIREMAISKNIEIIQIF